MHNLTGMIGFVAAIVSVFVIPRRIKNDPDWTTRYPVARVFRLAVLITFLLWIGAAKIAEIDSVNGTF